MVYFIVIILVCAPSASWRALAVFWCCCMQVASQSWCVLLRIGQMLGAGDQTQPFELT